VSFSADCAPINPIRGHRNARAILCAFDLLEVDGEDICAPSGSRSGGADWLGCSGYSTIARPR
jgi:hypothetical protein